MQSLINIAGISTLGTLGAIATITAAAINPIGAGLFIAGAILSWKRNK